MAATCDHCGDLADGAEPPLSWSLSMDRGQVKRYCERCTRENLRAVEGKLEVGHWEPRVRPGR